ncbi:MAG: YbaK/EbsC family protein [Gammaproteobacteria bacterium]|jgi:Cys-tRNA(Pro) deacylase
MTKLQRSAQAVQRALDAAGVTCVVEELPASTRSAAEAAAAIGCAVQQIAKTLVFRAGASGTAVVVIASGTNRVDEQKLAALTGERIERANPAFVREATGFAIGGVPPCGHTTATVVLIDQGLLRLPEIWAAAGTPHAVFRLSPTELIALTGGQVADIAHRD